MSLATTTWSFSVFHLWAKVLPFIECSLFDSDIIINVDRSSRGEYCRNVPVVQQREYLN